MQIIKDKKIFEKFVKKLQKRSFSEPKIEDSVRKILNDIKKSGDKALARYTKLFDKHSLPLKIGKKEIEKKLKIYQKTSLMLSFLQRKESVNFMKNSLKNHGSIRKEILFLDK